MRTIQFLLALILFAGTALAQDAESFYNDGVRLKSENKAKEALVVFQKAIRLKPNYAAAIYETGWCSNELKDYTGALTALRKARTLWPSIPKVHFELGYAFEKLNLFDSAINSYNACLRLNPEYFLAYKQLGMIDYDRENYPAALQRFAEYLTYIEDEESDYLFWYRKGFMENAEKKYSEAKESLRKSLMYKKDHINTYLELGFANNKMKLADEAINWYQEAIKINANSHIPYNGIAEVYRDTRKDIDMAMTWYQKSLGVKKDERKACFGMGYCLNSKGKSSEAIPYLEKAIQQEPTYTAAYVELGYSFYRESRNEDALKQFDKALSLNPRNENARYYAGLVYISMKNKTKAQQMADELKTLSSKNAAPLQEKVNKM